MDFTNLQFDKYQKRQFQLDDVEALVKYGNNYSVSRFMRDSFPYPYTKEHAVQWIDYVNGNNINLSLVIADDQELIGGIGAIIKMIFIVIQQKLISG